MPDFIQACLYAYTFTIFILFATRSVNIWVAFGTIGLKIGFNTGPAKPPAVTSKKPVIFVLFASMLSAKK